MKTHRLARAAECTRPSGGWPSPPSKSRQRKPPGSASEPPAKIPPRTARTAAGGPAAGGIERRQPWFSDQGCGMARHGTGFAEGVVRGEGFHSTEALVAAAEEVCRSCLQRGESVRGCPSSFRCASRDHLQRSPSHSPKPDRAALCTVTNELAPQRAGRRVPATKTCEQHQPQHLSAPPTKGLRTPPANFPLCTPFTHSCRLLPRKKKKRVTDKRHALDIFLWMLYEHLCGCMTAAGFDVEVRQTHPPAPCVPRTRSHPLTP